jgi:hypothetical protein
MIATCTTRSSKRSGRLFGSACIWARLSIWNMPTVSAARIVLNTSGSSWGRESRSILVPVSRSILSRHSLTTPSVRRESRSIFTSPSASMSSLSYWVTTLLGIVARSIGTRSISGVRVTSMPPTWIPR